MPQIETMQGGKKIGVQAAYYPPAIAKFKALGGRWSKSDRMWIFDFRTRDRVQKVINEVYGTGKYKTITIEVSGKDGQKPDLFRYGRMIASRKGRDAKVRLGSGVTIVEGSFGRRGGTQKYPALLDGGKVVLKIYDVPESLIDDKVILVEDQAQPKQPSQSSVKPSISSFSSEALMAELEKRGWQRVGDSLWRQE